MGIKFIVEEDKKKLTFNDVAVNEFFVDLNKDLLQKCDLDKAQLIARQDGTLDTRSEPYDYATQLPIRHIYKNVKIEFDY